MGGQLIVACRKSSHGFQGSLKKNTIGVASDNAAEPLKDLMMYYMFLAGLGS